jgi:CheY-like chemotaxis protein
MQQQAFTQTPMVNIVSVQRDGKEALDYLRRDGIYNDAMRPSLVLLDIVNVPKKNGCEVLQELKSDPHICSIPVVMFTTSERDEDIVRCYAKRACTFISKPVDREDRRQTAVQFALYLGAVAKIPAEDRSFRAASQG